MPKITLRKKIELRIIDNASIATTIVCGDQTYHKEGMFKEWKVFNWGTYFKRLNDDQLLTIYGYVHSYLCSGCGILYLPEFKD